MSSIQKSSEHFKSKLVFTGQVVDPQISEKDFRISVAGNRFQMKLINALSPDVFVNIIPLFLARNHSAQGLAPVELFLDARGFGPRPLRILSKIIGDSLHFLQLILFEQRMRFVFYNLDYSNVFLALLCRLFGHKTFVVAADYVSPATNIYEAFLLRAYKYMDGVILLRSNASLNSNSILLPAVVDIFPESSEPSVVKPNVLFSGSLGETTGLYIVLEAAVVCSHIRFYFTGRPFHMSESS